MEVIAYRDLLELVMVPDGHFAFLQLLVFPLLEDIFNERKR
jgi:hypothetical protein